MRSPDLWERVFATDKEPMYQYVDDKTSGKAAQGDHVRLDQRCSRHSGWAPKGAVQRDAEDSRDAIQRTRDVHLGGGDPGGEELNVVGGYSNHHTLGG